MPPFLAWRRSRIASAGEDPRLGDGDEITFLWTKDRIIALDSASGELTLRPKISSCQYAHGDRTVNNGQGGVDGNYDGRLALQEHLHDHSAS